MQLTHRNREQARSHKGQAVNTLMAAA